MLADTLGSTVLDLIDKYGNNIVISKDIQSGTYDPITDSYTTTTNIINTKGVFRKPSFNDDKSITNVIKIPYNDIDTDYKLNGNTILKIEPIMVQNKYIAMDVYV